MVVVMMNNTEQEYLFVHDSGGGWWLKLTTAEQIIDYFEHSTMYGEGLDLFWDYKKRGLDPLNLPAEEKINMMLGDNKKAFMYMQSAIIQARKYGCSILDGFKCLRLESAEKMLGDIRDYGACFVNSVGGSTYGVTQDNFCRRKSLVFPHFTQKDIRVKSFQNGKHFYAYIGDIQVRQGETLKWESYNEAYEVALSMV